MVVCGLGAALSLGIEALQLLTVDRTSAVSDIVANTFGALVGVIGAQLGENVSGRALKTLSSTGVLEQPSSYGALVAAIALCVAAWQPFDATLDTGSPAPRVRALMSDPWQAGPLTDEGIAAVHYALFAWVTGNLFVEARTFVALPLPSRPSAFWRRSDSKPARSSSDRGCHLLKTLRFERPP